MITIIIFKYFKHIQHSHIKYCFNIYIFVLCVSLENLLKFKMAIIQVLQFSLLRLLLHQLFFTVTILVDFPKKLHIQLSAPLHFLWLRAKTTKYNNNNNHGKANLKCCIIFGIKLNDKNTLPTLSFRQNRNIQKNPFYKNIKTIFIIFFSWEKIRFLHSCIRSKELE